MEIWKLKVLFKQLCNTAVCYPRAAKKKVPVAELISSSALQQRYFVLSHIIAE